jgi:hypothetical protein
VGRDRIRSRLQVHKKKEQKMSPREIPRSTINMKVETLALALVPGMAKYGHLSKHLHTSTTVRYRKSITHTMGHVNAD